MKQPLSLCVRFHTTPNGQSLPMLTCAETGRPIAGQYKLKLDYEGGNDAIDVSSRFLLEPEQPVRHNTELVSDDAVYEEDYDDEEEDYGNRVGF